jgi:hypothetical protein
MKTPIIYHVTYQLGEETKTKPFEADNPGHAFAKCLKAVPKATLIFARRCNKVGGSEFWIDYEPPKVQRPVQKKTWSGFEQTEIPL